MNYDRLDFFIERLLWYLHDRNQVHLSEGIIKLAQFDLEKEDERQVKIEDAALNDAMDHLKYGSGE